MAESLAGRRSPILATLRTRFAKEPLLSSLGVAGLGISFLCVVAVALRGEFIPPEGKMADAAVFTFGVALFTLTMALILPLARFSEKGRRRWLVGFSIFVIYGFILEPLQAWRGIDPRFTQVGGPVDVIAGIVFGMTAAVLTFCFAVLGLAIFRAHVLPESPLLRLGIRYGVMAVVLSFGVAGFVMSFGQGREIGAAGDLMLSHALGVHGIQAVPLVALALSGTNVAKGRRWVHVAGIGWLAACALALVQAIAGRPTWESSAVVWAMMVGLIVFAVAALVAGLQWWRQFRSAG